MKLLVVVFSLLGLFSGISGRNLPKSEYGDECVELLWNVVGDHYVPRKTCPVSTLDYGMEAEIRQKYYNELTAGQTEPDVAKINEILDKTMNLLPSRSQFSLKKELTCIACSAGVDTYRFLNFFGVPKNNIINLLSRACVDFNIMTPKICKGALDMYGKALMEVVDQTKSSSYAVCSLLLNTKCGNKVYPEFEWNVALPSTEKPPVETLETPPPTAPKLKVLHISDTHWDTQFKAGTWAECNLPICCREENVLPNENATKAGKYGGWRCDASEEAFDSVLSHVTEKHPDIDYIIWTGDIPAHDIWDQTRADNLGILKKTVAKLSKAFPKVPIYPALGNHESVPSNLFPTGKENGTNPMDWLFNEVNSQWSRWLPENVSQTVRLGAFYTTMIRPGLRLVSMNMNYCYKMNWWLVKDNQDPLGELQWLVKLLQEAEDRKEKVHIIGHIPPGHNDCWRAWQINYYKIMNRYESTVTSQFFGHTHADEFEVFYDMNNHSRPFGVAYLGPSVTTYMYHNPSYRIYYVEGDYDGTKRYVLDHESWYLDLEKSNKENRADWNKLYSAKDAYNMKSLYPADWHKIYLNIKNSNETLQQYHKYYWNDSPKKPFCGNTCRRNHLCDIRSCDIYGYPDN